VGTSYGDFVKYPRTPHLFGSRGTEDDRLLDEAASLRLLADRSLIVEEKLDGTNVGLHFSETGELVLQCRGHLITEGMHPQYDLFKQWAHVKRNILEQQLKRQFILFGEWLYAKHSIFYGQLTHYFYEFDIYDKDSATFLTLKRRMEILEGTGIQTVPVIHTGSVSRNQLESLIGESRFGGEFDNPATHRKDNLMEGLYLRTETEQAVAARAKFVRPEFVEKIKASSHWQYQAMTPNQLATEADIWS
jgi:hypothetical protein